MAEAPREPADVELLCPECDYNLAALTSDRCPWCGWQFDLDAIIEADRLRRGSGRIGVALAAAAVGIGSLIAFCSLFRSGQGSIRVQRLSVWDAVAVLSVLTASFANLSLAGLAVFSRARWPLRRGDAATILRVLAAVSIVAAFVGARPALRFAPTPLVVHDVQVNGVFEYFASGIFFSLPAMMLLLLTVVAFRSLPRAKPRAAAMDSPHGIQSGMAAGSPFLVEVSQRFAPEQLRVEWKDHPRPTTPTIEAHIASIWEVESERARAQNRTLFNGSLVRLIQAAVGRGMLQLEVGPTSYRDFLGTNLHGLQTVMAEGPAALANAVGVSAIVATPDGFLAFGRRNDRVNFHAGYLHTFGGLLEASDRSTSGQIDVVAALHRELYEELGVEQRDIANTVIIGLVRDTAILQPELLFDVTVKLTRPQLHHVFAGLIPNEEHTAIEFVPDEPDSIIGFIRRSDPIAPVAQTALLLHGLHAWGSSWYEQTCYILYGELPAAAPTVVSGDAKCATGTWRVA